jgi:demethylmenaquinone methyltransferase/2-methoxy-6-polyprenyl-1,4-benzoquinol methylase
MFDAIAPRYDVLNHVLSVGLDRSWRRTAIDALACSGTGTLLDLCTGTADLAIAAVRRRHGVSCAIGVDFAGAMLVRGSRKVHQGHLNGRVRLVQADVIRLPIASGSVDATTAAFGIRNVQDPRAACREMHRALRPGGRVAILEFGLPTAPVIRPLYLWYFRHVLPLIGRLVSRHPSAYAYLPASVSTFFSPESFAGLLREVGFSEVRAVPLTLGIVYLYVATKGSSYRGSSAFA